MSLLICVSVNVHLPATNPPVYDEGWWRNWQLTGQSSVFQCLCPCVSQKCAFSCVCFCKCLPVHLFMTKDGGVIGSSVGSARGGAPAGN